MNDEAFYSTEEYFKINYTNLTFELVQVLVN